MASHSLYLRWLQNYPQSSVFRVFVTALPANIGEHVARNLPPRFPYAFGVS